MPQSQAEQCAQAFESAFTVEKPISYDQALHLVELVCANGDWLAKLVRDSSPFNQSDD